MHLPILWIFLIAAVLLGEIQAASAQSPTSYPWCARYFDRKGGATSCYFDSYHQCMTTLSGIGGFCYQSPYYQAAPTTAPPVGQDSRPAHPRPPAYTRAAPILLGKQNRGQG
jgi:hypothetical protein